MFGALSGPKSAFRAHRETFWTVAVTLPSGAVIVNSWNASRTANSGAIRFTNAAHNGTIAAGQSTEFGYQGTGTGTGVTPTCTAS